MEAEVAFEMVADFGEVEVTEAPEVAEGEATEGEEVVVTSRPPLALLERAARQEIDSWPGWPMRQSPQSLVRHRPSRPAFFCSPRTLRHRQPQVRLCLGVFPFASCLTPGQPTAL